ncbi:dihydroneopterin aldolase [Proteinivorax tanatarense]|uniref:7,8-dihydroneopterin aldolase n=1 Tax=Proteinivorax tanatarense TaxID=1260629 RepID=A0AAU7VJP0_9FIRM
MDKIIMKNMYFYGNHGVLEEEKALGQKFIVDIELFLDIKKAGVTDDVNETVSYAEVFELIQILVEKERYHLLEALAENIAQKVLDKFAKVLAIDVTVKKPEAPVKGKFDYFAVEIRRSKDG